MKSSRTMRPDDWPKLRHFKASEFRHPERMGFEFMLWLDQVRQAAGVPMVVTSDWRSREHNAEVDGAKGSAHIDTPCQSVDIGARPRADDPHWNNSRFEIMWAAMRLGCTRLGTYKDGSVHLDRTEGTRPSRRVWIVVDNPA